VLCAGSFASAGSVLSGMSRWSVLAWRSRRRTARGLLLQREARSQEVRSQEAQSQEAR